jgi:hypothetical protein
MISRFPLGFAALGCVLLASCYPYNEHPNKGMPQNNKPADKTITAADQQKLKEQRERMKQQDELKKTEEQKTAGTDTAGTSTTPGTTPPPSGDGPKPAAEPKRDFAFANKVPGKDGFVFSPYNNKVVDVRDIPSGTLVQDPTYPAAEKKYFRVP